MRVFFADLRYGLSDVWSAKWMVLFFSVFFAGLLIVGPFAIENYVQQEKQYRSFVGNLDPEDTVFRIIYRDDLPFAPPIKNRVSGLSDLTDDLAIALDSTDYVDAYSFAANESERSMVLLLFGHAARQLVNAEDIKVDPSDTYVVIRGSKVTADQALVLYREKVTTVHEMKSEPSFFDSMQGRPLDLSASFIVIVNDLQGFLNEFFDNTYIGNSQRWAIVHDIIATMRIHGADDQWLANIQHSINANSPFIAQQLELKEHLSYQHVSLRYMQHLTVLAVLLVLLLGISMMLFLNALIRKNKQKYSIYGLLGIKPGHIITQILVLLCCIASAAWLFRQIFFFLQGDPARAKPNPAIWIITLIMITFPLISSSVYLLTQASYSDTRRIM